MSEPPCRAQDTLKQAIGRLAAQAPEQAETKQWTCARRTLAIKFALERFEKGEVKVNAVRKLLTNEHGLRVGARFWSMKTRGRGHGPAWPKSNREILDRQSWACVQRVENKL